MTGGKTNPNNSYLGNQFKHMTKHIEWEEVL